MPKPLNPTKSPYPHLILASTSRYRRELLERLGLEFSVQAPGVDETPVSGESPAAAARRLSLAKAQAVAAIHPQAWVIGSDQTASLDGVGIIGKPLIHERAVAQLTAASGKTLHFYTGVALVCSQAKIELFDLSQIQARFRVLSPEQIETYLRREQPYDCAGSAKSEGLGIALLESITGTDPSALVGLPLTRLCSLLVACGFDPITRRFQATAPGYEPSRKAEL